MNILLTNDDGIYAKGLRALYERFVQNHSITIIAPDRERSAAGHCITLHKPIRAEQVSVTDGYSGYAVTGTPADCVKLGVLEILETRPDLIISGINPGANVGIDINYSGTAAAAREAALYGIPAIAVSVKRNAENDYNAAAIFIEGLANKVFDKGLPSGTMLNVNIPDIPFEKIAGIRISRQDVSLLSEYFEKRADPRNRIYYWHGSITQSDGDNPDIDRDALNQNYISITPIKCDMTNYKIIDDLKKWDLK